MKILELCMSTGFGGLELYFLDTYRHFGKSDIDCYVAVRPNTRLSKGLNYPDEKVILVYPRSRYFPFITAFRLARFIDKNRIDIIHMHWAKDLALAVLTKAFCRRKPRLVYTRHMAILGQKHDLYHRRVYGSVDKLITVTDELKEQAEQFLPIDPSHITRLYLGTQEDKIRITDIGKCREIFNIDRNKFVIGIVGRIEEKKGQQILIEAIHILINQGLDLDCYIVGTPTNPDYLMDLSDYVKELGIESSIRFYGFSNEPKELMRCFDIVVLATFHETFGLVLIEAMSMGVPVIGTNKGGVREIIDNQVNGLLVQPENAQDLAVAIKFLYDNPEKRREYSSNGIEKIKKQFNLESHYTSLIKILHDVLR